MTSPTLSLALTQTPLATPHNIFKRHKRKKNISVRIREKKQGNGAETKFQKYDENLAIREGIIMLILFREICSRRRRRSGDEGEEEE